ncbi:MAG TPA: BlaI/MecI/CopY family transcriptional regulator [Gemmatimonadaceae bacterium]|nr:BlaI/MecI/CopY family transcriptional regulator [Gemmatimonadaceae bacterium]
MTKPQPHADLSRRERQIMDAVYRLGRATAAAVTADLPDPPSSTAVRTMLRILEDKGHIKHEHDGVRFIYSPVMPRDQARKSVLTHVVRTFFDGSAEQAMATLLANPRTDITDKELDRLASLIEQARNRQKGR